MGAQLLRITVLLSLMVLTTSCWAAALYKRLTEGDEPPRLAKTIDVMTDGMPTGDVEDGGDQLPLESRFKEAQREALKKLKVSTPEEIKFRIYGLLKQAKEGDAKGQMPGATNQKERAKYDAWASLQGMSPQQAMEAYIKSVADLES